MKSIICFMVVFSTMQIAFMKTTSERKPGGLKIPPAPPSKALPNAYHESKRGPNESDESRVTITVGEERFAYTVNGLTRSAARIAVSGEYFNDEIEHYGYARLFLMVEGIGYYAVRPVGNRLDVYVEDHYYDQFYFEVFSPYPVRAQDLRVGQYNSSTILVTGPSRSSAHYGNKVNEANEIESTTNSSSDVDLEADP